jgi:tRNA uridine 5-carboxymethylaminomethyl modification enzyme
MTKSRAFDVIVIGAGHAGCEAAYAAARLGLQVGLCTLSESTVAHMPCNPAVGGTAKGHLVREIDALGGLMGEAIDATGIQFKLLNRSRGPAVWSPRAQADKKVYGEWMRQRLSVEPNITWLIGRAGRIVVDGTRLVGLEFEDGASFSCGALVVTTGTFLNGLIHVGPEQRSAGRADEPATCLLSESLKSLGLQWGRLKTGTPPRLDRASIDFSRFQAEGGDEPPVPFSYLTGSIERRQISCHLLHTNDRVRELVREHIDCSPLYNGQIKGIGPRYCPSLEDKIMRFPDKESHQIFLEPEGADVPEIYVNGFSMSLPREVQEKLVHALPGLGEAVMLRPGYAIEYDFVQPTELRRTLETQRIDGLFLAGQINGTSGYEEAAAQGLLAGINAGLKVIGRQPFTLRRDEAYIGILVDDLTTRGCLEPYRMFTSRAEHRLLLRIDNADLRLTPRGREIGIVDDERWRVFEARRGRLERNRAAVESQWLESAGEGRVRASAWLKRPEVRLDEIRGRFSPPLELHDDMAGLDSVSVETDVKYEGYLKRQARDIERARREEGMPIPASFSYAGVPGLSREIVERLTTTRPETIGQASRVPGVTPAAVAVIQSHVRRRTAFATAEA